jgi:microcystin-dependent protein
MSEPFIAEIRIFASNFAPRGWAFCDGQRLPIAQNTALFSLVGTTFGGDGRTDFGLPDLRGRTTMHPGRGPGLTDRLLGESGGQGSVTLTQAQMPAHNHSARATQSEGTSATPAGNTWARDEAGDAYRNDTANVSMSDETLAVAGSSQSHNNLQPYLVLNFIIALEGLYPSRS